MRFSFAAVLLLGLGTTFAAAQSAHWEYQGHEGPFNWGKLDPAYKACGDGHEQSPIDIRGAKLNKALQPIEFHYMATSMKLENNGHTIVVYPKPGSYIVAGGVRYDLKQFHFHRPSEEAVGGKLTDMDVHLVHEDASGKLAVIAVRLIENRDAPNATLAALWQALPKESGKTSNVEAMVNPAGLLPANHGYWTYMGSLTTPPCTEGVHWFVMVDEVTLSRDQLHDFTTLYRLNSRPLQDRNGRRIEANQ
ncbi:MAG TPA: carbonic anhydrase family protein [Terracidiphilus sp.]